MDIFNEYQTPLEELHLDEEPQEVQEQFYDFLETIPFIKNLVSPNRPKAIDLPRDDEGRAIIDVTNPPILENMDYFRPAAIHYQNYGTYTSLRPNPNPNSEYVKWIREEVRRCYEGYVRESDGMWISGDNYFFLNYCPIQLIKLDAKGKANRVIDFPRVQDGQVFSFHYLLQSRNNGHHSGELAKRGAGKSFKAASMLAKRFLLGESQYVNKKVQCVVTANERKYIQGANQVLDMFQYYIDFLATNTEFPKRRITNSLQNLQWTSGYVDVDTGTKKGSQNSVIGITSKDDSEKLRGSRGVLYLLEEAGTFSHLLELYSTIRPSVEDGDRVFGQLYFYGTAGSDESDFSSMQELMYNPEGYNIQKLPNVYDKEGQGRPFFVYFFGGYLGREGCYDGNGNSDVTKSILQILRDRYKVKHNSTDINSITRRIAEIPITPQEAILRTSGNIFPITQLTERLNQLDNNPNEYDDVYIGELVLNKGGEVEFRPTNDIPIREFPLKDNKVAGALEIYSMPVKNRDGEIPNGRYIVSLDPTDADESNTLSLSSCFVLDLFTDNIVAEFTGRKMFADDNYEIVRLLCLFYNAKCLYENNLKGCFAYFQRMNSTHLLADTPEYLKDRQMIKGGSYGNVSKGVPATNAINNYANSLIRDWLLKPITTIQHINNEDVEVTIPNLYRLRNRALIKELILFNPDINVDRVRSLGILMLYREEKMILYQGDMTRANKLPSDYAGNDPFFKQFDDKISKLRNYHNIFDLNSNSIDL